jgi:hypothetical protein
MKTLTTMLWWVRSLRRDFNIDIGSVSFEVNEEKRR